METDRTFLLPNKHLPQTFQTPFVQPFGLRQISTLFLRPQPSDRKQANPPKTVRYEGLA